MGHFRLFLRSVESVDNGFLFRFRKVGNQWLQLFQSGDFLVVVDEHVACWLLSQCVRRRVRSGVGDCRTDVAHDPVESYPRVRYSRTVNDHPVCRLVGSVRNDDIAGYRVSYGSSLQPDFTVSVVRLVRIVAEHVGGYDVVRSVVDAYACVIPAFHVVSGNGPTVRLNPYGAFEVSPTDHVAGYRVSVAIGRFTVYDPSFHLVSPRSVVVNLVVGYHVVDYCGYEVDSSTHCVRPFVRVVDHVPGYAVLRCGLHVDTVVVRGFYGVVRERAIAALVDFDTDTAGVYHVVTEDGVTECVRT